MADDDKILLQADLKQPSEQLTELSKKLETVLSATKSLQDQFSALADSKIGVVTAKQFDTAARELMRAVQNTMSLVKNENLGGRIGTLVAQGMADGIKANQVTLSKTVMDALNSVFKDAEKLVAGNKLAELLGNKNLGTNAFVTQTRSDLRAGQIIGAEKLAELTERQRAAELLLAQARADNLLKGDASTNKLVAQRQQELGSIQSLRKEIQAQTKDLNDQLKAQERLAASIERRAQVAAQASLRPAARLSVLDTINQTTGVERAADDEKALSDLRARYRSLSDKRADIMAAMDDVAKAKAAAQIARQDEARARRENADPARLADLHRDAAAAQAAYQNSVANAQKDLQRLRLFGDGGQFLLEIQARLMLNYKVLNSFFQAIGYGVSSVVQFDDALHQLQAISGATKGEMVELKAVITGVADSSRFTAVEITKAATALAQAGLSSTQIKAALEPITKLATSTGTDLKQAVDVVTSVFGAFNYRAEETSQIVNIMAGALNSSKLDMEKLALGIQYSGNSAAQANISFSELTTVIAALANTGVKSGSTLGTGVTQLISDLLAPSAKLKQALDSVGLTMADVDIRSRGLIAVLKSMTEAGFGASQAFEGFELRGARAFLGLSGQIGQLQNLQREILLSNAAYDGSKVAMDSLQAAIDKLKANFGTLSDAIGQTFLKQVTTIANSLADVVKWFKEWGVGVSQVVIALAGGAIFALLASYLVNVAVAIGRIITTSVSFVGALIAARTAAFTYAETVTYATVATTRFASAMSLLGRVGIPLAVFAAFEIFSLVLSKSATDAEKFREKMEKVNQTYNEATQAVQKQTDTQDALDKAILDLMQRYTSLNRDSAGLSNTTLELRGRFADLGLELPKTVTRVEELIDALNRLKRTSQQQEILDLGKKIEAGEEKAKGYRERFNNLTSTGALDTLLKEGPTGGAGAYFRGDMVGPTAPRNSNALENLQNAAGVAQQIKDMVTAIQSKSTDAVAKARSDLEKLLKELEKSEAQGVVKFSPGDSITVPQQAALARALLAHSMEVMQTGLAQQRADTGVANDKQTKAVTEELQKPIYELMNKLVTDRVLKLQQMREQLAQAPTDEKRPLVDQMREEANRMVLDVNQMFQSYVSNLSADARKVAEEAFKSKGSAGLAASSEKGRADVDTKAAMTDVIKFEQIRLETQKRVINLEIENAQSRLKLAKDFDTVAGVNAELLQLEARLLDVQKQLNTKGREQLTGKQNKAELESLIQTQDAEVDALRQKGLERRLRNTEETAKQEKARLDAETQMIERAINATISAQMASMQGLLGKAMPSEQKERIFQQITMLLEQIMTLQIKQLIRTLEMAGEDPDAPKNRAGFDAIISAGRENIKRFESQIKNNELRAGQDELSREMRQMLADITVSLQKLAQAFKDIERGLENARREADNIQNRFNYSQAAYDSPQNRGRFASTTKQVVEFEEGFGVGNRVRQMKIESETRAMASYQQLVNASKERVDTLEAEKQKLEKVAAGNNVNNAALAAVKEKLQSAQGQYEQYQQALEKARIELERLGIEQSELNKKKEAPGVFETMQNGFKAWVIQNGLFRDGLAQIGEQVPNMLNAMASGFAGFFNDVTMGTKSVGQAFGDMARNIIKSMIQILNQMVAMQLVKGIFSMFGMAFGGGGFNYTGGTPTTSIPNAYSGGIVRRAGGGMSTRDSVLYALTPGEFVMRQAAVNAVGRDTLEDINQMGNRSISVSPERALGAPANSKGGIEAVNVWVVPPHDQPPPPSEKDIIAVVTKDMTNSGATRQLLKSIQNNQV